ncbi:hypothetical protein FKM82_016978 [Ascaphus truei]
MSECKAVSSDTYQDVTKLHQAQAVSEKGQKDDAGKPSKGYSALVFLREGKGKRKQNRNHPDNLSKEFKESENKPPLDFATVAKKCEVVCFEEVSNEFTCSTSITESYQLNTNKEAKYCFRKLDDGTFAIEKKDSNELHPGTSEPGTKKRTTKMGHQKERYTHKPLKICFKKRSKALRKPSDSNDDDDKLNNKICAMKCDANTPTQADSSQHGQSTGKTWATFKRLVTRRNKLQSSLKRQSHLNGRHLETNSGSTCIQRVSKKKAFSSLGISCMNFSRGKRSGQINIPMEETHCSLKSNETSEAHPGPDCEKSDEALAIKYKLQRSIDAELENGNVGKGVDQGILNNTEEFLSLTKPKSSIDQLTQNTDIKSEPETIKEQVVEEGGTISVCLEETQGDHLSDDFREDCKSKNHCMCLFPSPIQEQVLRCCTIKSLDDKKNTQQTGKHELNEESCNDGDIGQTIEAHKRNKTSESYLAELIDCAGGLNNVYLVNDVANPGLQLSDEYEMLLMTTAASLVKTVIQSSIQQLVDERSLGSDIPGKES